MTPASLPDYELFVPISQADLNTARLLMSGGFTLKEAAFNIGVLPRDLDLALWRAIGRRP